MIKKLFIAVVISLIILMTVFHLLFRAMHSEQNYKLNELDTFLDQLEVNYHYIRDTDVVTLYGKVIIKIYYVGHPELDIDEDLYLDLENFFTQTEIQKKMIEKEHSNEVHLLLEFMDTVGTDSHYIRSEIKQILRTGRSNGRYTYSRLSGPTYYVERD